jgi:hypothetical protein
MRRRYLKAIRKQKEERRETLLFFCPKNRFEGATFCVDILEPSFYIMEA